MGCCKPPVVGFKGNAPESFGYFTNPRFSNNLSIHHLVAKSFPFIGLSFCLRKTCMVTLSAHHHTLNGNAKMASHVNISQIFF